MLEIRIDKKDIKMIRNLLNDLSPGKQDGAIHQAMIKASDTVLQRLVANVSGLVLKRRTGDLARSIGFRIEKNKEGIESVIGSGASRKTARTVYANIHETGGTIRPKRARKLAIPIGAALTPSGVARFTPAELKNGSAGYDESFIAKSKAGSLIIYGKKDLKIIPLFILKDQAKIPAHKYMAITAEQVKDKVVEDIVGKIKEAKEKA